jgi:hypothetical protein
MADEAKVKLGIKETKEALVALGALAVVCRKAFGAAGGDFGKLPAALTVALTSDAAAMASIAAGYEGSNQIVPEIKDLDTAEKFELAALALTTVGSSFAALKV